MIVVLLYGGVLNGLTPNLASMRQNNNVFLEVGSRITPPPATFSGA